MLGKALESEFQHLISGMSLAGWIGHFLAAAIFGVAVPLRQGFDFLDVMFLLAYACLPCLFAAPLVAESVASRRTPPPVAGYIAQILTPFLFASVWNMVIIASGIAAVNASHWHGRLILPSAVIFCNVLILSFAAAFFASAITGWLSLNVATAALAKAHARRLFLLVLVLVLMWARLGPPTWKRAVESRLTTAEITSLLLPVSAILGLLGAALMRAGARRRAEEAAGPLLKLT